MSRSFDGVTSQLGLPVSSILRPALPVTVSAWIKPRTIVVGGGITTNNKTDPNHRGFWVSIADSSGHIEASYGDNTGTASTDRRSKVSTDVIRLGVWQHLLVAIRASTDMQIFIDGKPAGGNYSGTGGTMAYNTAIGGRIGNEGGSLFDGEIEDLAWWNQPLQIDEAIRLASGVPLTLIRPGARLAHWSLDDAAGIDRWVNRLDVVSTSGSVPLRESHPTSVAQSGVPYGAEFFPQIIPYVGGVFPLRWSRT